MTISPRIAEANAAIAARQPSDVSAAVALYRAEGEAGNAAALFRSAVFAAEGFGRPSDWAEALELLTTAAERGDAEAQAQLRLLADAAEGTSWRSLCQRIDLQDLLTPPSFTRAPTTSMIATAKAFAPPRFAAALIELAQARLGATTTYQVGRGQTVDPTRTALGAWLGPLDRDLVCAVLQERAARACGLPVANHETPNVLSYDVGQKFEPHFDFVAPLIRELGQRTFTFVTYLSQDFTGGQTYFPLLGLSFRGQAGDAIWFSNLLPDGSPDKSTLHAGLPPESGRKWALSQWIRAKPQPWR